MSPTLYPSLHPALQSLLSPTGHPPTPPAPHQSLSADQTALLLSTPPHPPSSHIPLSCAAAMHKYINLVSVYACLCQCVCVCAYGWGMSTYRHGPATPQAGPLSCVTRSQMLCVYTPNPSRHITRAFPRHAHTHTPSQPYPQEPVTPAEEAQGQKLRVSLEVVVPDWLSDVTDCHRPDGRYSQGSEVKQAIK